MGSKRKDTREAWAKAVVERALGVSVVIHDDGSAASMYDLRVGPADAPEMAIEVSGAVDSLQTQTWNTGPAKGAVQLPIQGDWVVTVEPGFPGHKAAGVLTPILQSVEALGSPNVDLRGQEGSGAHPVAVLMASAKIISLDCIKTAGTGAVYMTMDGFAATGAVGATSLPAWVSDWLVDPVRSDVVSKLLASNAVRKDVFIAAESGTPDDVLVYLSGLVTNVPATAPVLPSGIDGVWVCPTQWYEGVYWDGSTWRIVWVSDRHGPPLVPTA